MRYINGCFGAFRNEKLKLYEQQELKIKLKCIYRIQEI